MYKILFFYLLVIASICFSQTKTVGTLQRINFLSKTYTESDTTGFWFISGNEVSNYENVFSYNNKIYTTSYHSKPGAEIYGTYRPNFYSITLKTLNDASKHILVNNSMNPECTVQTYGTVQTLLKRANDKIILTNNNSWQIHLLSKDNVYDISIDKSGKIIRHIAGKVGTKFLVVAMDSSDYKTRYFLNDLSNVSPLSLEEEITFDKTTKVCAPFKISAVNDSLYLVEQEWESNHPLHLFVFKNNVFTSKDTLHIGAVNYGNWVYKENELYYSKGVTLLKRTFDKVSNKFSLPQIVNQKFWINRIDLDENYLFSFLEKTISVFSIVDKKLICSLTLTDDYIYNPMPDPPFLYLHKKTEVISSVNKSLPTFFSLSQNYPNPFNPETTIEFSIPNSQFVILKVYDVLGREVATLVNEVKAPGNYAVAFNARHLERSREIPSGVYFCRLSTNNFSKTIKLSLVK